MLPTTKNLNPYRSLLRIKVLLLPIEIYRADRHNMNYYFITIEGWQQKNQNREFCVVNHQKFEPVGFGNKK